MLRRKLVPRADVGIEILEHEERVVVLYQVVQYGPECGAAAVEEAVNQLARDLLEPRVVVCGLVRVVAAVSVVVCGLVRSKAEYLYVVVSDLFLYLYVCSVQGAQRYRAVHHELHVACAGRFLARRGDLLGDVRRRVNDLAKGHAEVLREHDLYLLAYDRVGVHYLRYAVDELYDVLGERVALGRLAREDEGDRLNIDERIVAEPVVEVHYLERVQQLALVGVNPLHLNVHYAVRIDGRSAVLYKVVR